MQIEVTIKLLNKLYGEELHFSIQSSSNSSEPDFFVVYGSNQYPKWILPSSPYIGLPAVAGWSPYGIKTLIKWKFLKIAYKFGFLKYFNNVVKVYINPNMANNFPVLTFNEKKYMPTIYVGNSDTSTQKLIVLLTQVDTKVISKISKPEFILKVPIGVNAEQAITNETRILEKLTNCSKLVVPKLIKVSSSNFLQSYLDCAAYKGKLSQKHIDLLLSFPTSSEKIVLNQFLQSLKARLEGLDNISFESRKLILKSIKNIYDDTHLSAVLIHGDFAPWNIKVLSNHQLSLIDWESAQFYCLPLVDLIHHQCISLFAKNYTIYPFSNLIQNSIVQLYMDHFGIKDDLAEKIYYYYWIERYCTFLELNELSTAELLLKKLYPILKERF